MSSLLYREDADQVRDRLRRWWRGEDLGRPMLQLTAPLDQPVESVPALPRPPNVQCDRFTTLDMPYRLNVMARACLNTAYFGEALPSATLSLGPSTLALYLGCRGVENADTTWFEPCIADPDQARFEFDPANPYWIFQQELIRQVRPWAQGRFLLDFPDFIEGLDILAAMRGAETLMLDLLERPAWIQRALTRTTELYFRYYDPVYELIKDDTGGVHWWVWAPGRLAKLQCDYSAMISPDMFKEFMLPVLRAQTERLDYAMYHWDGPGALGHHNHLLSLPKLTMIQWTAGAGAESVFDRRWWPMYHKTIEAGKKLFIAEWNGLDTAAIRTLKREFGPQLNQFLIAGPVNSAAKAAELIRVSVME